MHRPDRLKTRHIAFEGTQTQRNARRWNTSRVLSVAVVVVALI